ncbi:MAG: hypothetical protein ACRELX_15110, partial [Longimicrobiales bacterium]
MKSRLLRNGNGGARRRLRLAALIALPVVGACDDGFGPQNWDATPDTVVVFSISRPELLGKPSGFDMTRLEPVTIESPLGGVNWDFALAEQDGEFVMLPASSIEGLGSRAAIAP